MSVEQFAQRAAQPFVRGDVEADFFARENRWRQFIFHQFFENEFLARALDFQGRGQRGGEFHDAMIEERRADFDGVRHAHAVNLGEDVAGKIIFLIEPEEGREWVWRCEFSAQLAEDSVQRIG